MKNTSITSIQKLPNVKTNYATNLYANNINVKNSLNASYQQKPLPETKLSKFNNETKDEPEQYTYEGAIQNYRTRIKSKINIDESIFNKPQEFIKSKEVNEAQNLLPKGNLFKRKEMFEGDNKTVEIGHLESPTSRRLSEEFANSQSIKDRLKSLVQYTEQPLKTTDKNELPVKSLKERLQNFNRQSDNDNNNYKPLRESVSHTNINKISNYLLDKSNSHSNIETKNIKNDDWRIKDEISDRSSSPETEMYMNKLNMFNRDLDTLYGKSIRNIDNDELNYLRPPAYITSVSSNDLITGSDREDSGIHTADVSCSVSQADEQPDDTELCTPICVDKVKLNGTDVSEQIIIEKEPENLLHKLQQNKNIEELINSTLDFIDAERKYSDLNIVIGPKVIESNDEEKEENDIIPEYSQPVIYENVELKPFGSEFVASDLFSNPDLSLAPPKHKKPPSEKPPPPPPTVDNEKPEVNLNTTKRIKKEIQLKRSSFLGLDEPLDDHLDTEGIIKPPDLKSLLQKESNLSKSLYKKLQGSREGGLSEVESQDSGLEIERGRLSSDTWCSSLIDTSTPVHNRQDSGVS